VHNAKVETEQQNM